ncbi:hypothetical protein [Streptacidiphilus melanogenes]|uniref:hypothetical protein n=1 Tax=Streptacidiphilus melanogenes TaxID=411235 RepID=UPI000694DE1E|nr:hypothetical protein [Streptacidiphilus melanogenes]
MPRLLPPGRLRPGLVVLALLVSVATAACSSSKSSNSASQPTTPSAAATTAAATGASAGATGGATTVTVTETEFTLHLSQTSFTPGSYTFVAKDDGHVSHALAIAGPGVPTTQTGTLDPGSSANLTVTLQKGSYELWCPVDSHKSLGMDTHIQVS